MRTALNAPKTYSSGAPSDLIEQPSLSGELKKIEDSLGRLDDLILGISNAADSVTGAVPREARSTQDTPMAPFILNHLQQINVRLNALIGRGNEELGRLSSAI